jgi:hypothetical protein
MTDDISWLREQFWIAHRACVSWSEPDRWLRFFEKAQETLGAEITRLDENDPVRRRVKRGKLAEAAQYVTAFGKLEESRWVFGAIDSLKIRFSISYDRGDREWAHSFDWYFSRSVLDDSERIETICKLFELGNSLLSPFYSYADTLDVLNRRKKRFGGVNVYVELLGVFWLTYFGPKYVEFLGKEKLDALEEIKVTFNEGATLRLGATPQAVSIELRDSIESKLGRKIFLEPDDKMGKRPGQYALGYDKLRS